MRTFGFRAEKDKVFYAIVEGSQDEPVLLEHDKFSAPTSYSLPQQLSWYRNRVQTLIQRHSPSSVCVRQAETRIPRKPSVKALESMFTRAKIEGVLLEAVDNTNTDIHSGKMQNLASKLGSRSAKKYLENNNIRGVDLEKIKNNSMKEAILAAIAVLG